MGSEGAKDTAEDLHPGIAHQFPRRDLPAHPEDKTYRRIEMCAGDSAAYGNQDNQDRPCRQGVAEEGERHVSARQSLGHDAGPNDGCDKDASAERLSYKAA